jgi:Fic family protein
MESKTVRKSGQFVSCYEGRESFYSFIPFSLPPNPKIKFDTELSILMDKANRFIGELNGITKFLPNPGLFTHFYIMKEAMLSSQIEGTQSTFSELLVEPKEISLDNQEVWNYVAAFRHGLSTLTNKSPAKITLTLICEMHQLLLDKTKDDDGKLGKFRQNQNWVSGDRPSKAKYVPPPPEEVLPALENLENFLNNIPEKTPVLMKAALAHVQFESIHPFMNGNGRLGRLLIVLLLCMEKALREPMLYISLYFKTNYSEYCERLQKVRETGDWEGWLKFFFTGVIKVSQQAIDTAAAILDLFENDKSRIETFPQPKTSNQIQSYLQKRPIVSIKELSKELKISIPSITHGLERLEKMGIVKELTGNNRNRLFAYKTYLNILSSETEPVEEEIMP